MSSISHNPSYKFSDIYLNQPNAKIAVIEDNLFHSKIINLVLEKQIVRFADHVVFIADADNARNALNGESFYGYQKLTSSKDLKPLSENQYDPFHLNSEATNQDPIQLIAVIFDNTIHTSRSGKSNTGFEIAKEMYNSEIFPAVVKERFIANSAENGLFLSKDEYKGIFKCENFNNKHTPPQLIKLLKDMEVIEDIETAEIKDN